jgi:hypothetical protein
MGFARVYSNVDEIYQPVMKKKIKAQEPKFRVAPFIVIFVFLALGAVGISLGEPSRVLEQAKQICLSCIGIG